MRLFKVVILFIVSIFSLNAKALIIKDVISVNDYLEIGSFQFDFDLTEHGYNHATDTIKFVELSYNILKVDDDWDDPDDISTWEGMQRNSYLFDGRIIYADVSAGLYGDRLSWQKDESYCQFENNWNECELNLDLYGNAREFLSTFTDKIWLGDVTFSVEVDRVTLPEPSSIVLFALGFISYLLMRVRPSVTH